MPVITILNSTKISKFGYKAVFDLVLGKLFVDLSPSVWIGAGYTTISGARAVITSPSGQILVNGLVFTPPMNQIIQPNIPLFDGVYEYGIYQFRLTLVDGAVETSIEGTFDLCAPASNQSKYGEAILRIDADCDDMILKVYGGAGYNYRGVVASTWAKNYTLYYPVESGQADLVVNSMPIQATLYTGLTKIKGYSDGTFVFPENYEVKIRFNGEVERYVQCNFPCHVWCAYEKLVADVADAQCGTRNHERLYEKLQTVNVYVTLILLGIRCAKNVDGHIQTISDLLGVENCPCGDDETVLLGVAQAAPITTTTTSPIISLPTTTIPITTTVPVTTLPATTLPATTTDPTDCSDVTDIVMTFV